MCHYPPGTSKWNKIEHRLFSFISINWRGRPLTDIRTIVELIAATTTRTGLTVQAAYDPEWYATGVKISNADYATIGTASGTTPSPQRRDLASYPAARPNRRRPPRPC